MGAVLFNPALQKIETAGLCCVEVGGGERLKSSPWKWLFDMQSKLWLLVEQSEGAAELG